MYLCYIDESGTSDIPGNTSHFVLSGLSIPIWYLKDCDRTIETIKRKYVLENSEIHDLLKLFSDNRGRYLVIGGYVVIQYAEPRYTKDLNLWISPDTTL